MNVELGLNFADAETPVVVGNMMYLQHVPQQGSLQLFRNGLLMSASAGDYALTGQVLKLIPDLAAGDTVICFYRW